MAWLTGPTIWTSPIAPIVLEIALGIDNLIFIAILATKLLPAQRDKRRIVDLSFACQCASGCCPSCHGCAGVFLLSQATAELYERLEGMPRSAATDKKTFTGFWLVAMQILVLNAVFLLAAVIISMGMMLLASKPLTRFVTARPTVMGSCLSVLLVIGRSLVAEGLRLHIAIRHLRAAIEFPIVIETFNRFACRSRPKYQAMRPMREHATEAILASVGVGRSSPRAGIQQRCPAALRG
ncbi:TerC family protein [Burkholderia territorii]|uniref:TerC family protein n=1 Tax=Burkholderia territorii TaxID=1503055 RepID=UPI0014783A02|nr:hypothetical protein [Burkholderia territorii]MBM2777464.1 hypothetical protein [Burkholderia territorii]